MSAPKHAPVDPGPPATARRQLSRVGAAAGLGADGASVYFGANKGGVYALGTADGKLRWQSPIFGSLYGGLTLDKNGILYTGSTVGHFLGIDSANGQWLFDHDAQSCPGIWAAPAIRPDGSVAIGTRRGEVLLFGP